MRRADPLEPEVAAALHAIDATLDGEPVDPEHAELAELALLLRAGRPAAEPASVAAIDARVAGRLDAPPRRWRPQWLAAPVVALAAVALVVVLIVSHGARTGDVVSDIASTVNSSTSASVNAAPGSSSSAAGSAPSPISSGRQIVQSAQLALTTAPDRIDAVAQEVFDVVDAQRGTVSSSHVTSTGNDGSSADFQLSVPSASLQQTMAALSQLAGARVVSRTDDTNDITGQVGGAGRALSDERAFRRALLRQIAATTSGSTLSALRSKLGAVEAAIGRDEAQLNGLHRQVQYSTVSVTLQAGSGTAGGTFTLHRALHDAGRVLVVVAGGALIALAALIPVALVVTVLVWLALWLRRRRRESALDGA